MMNEEKQGFPVDRQFHCDPLSWAEKYADYLYSFAMSRLRDEEAARDLVQDTFLAALQQLTLFEGNSSEKTWLSAILKNKISDFYRKKASRGLKEITQAETVQQDFFDAETGHWHPAHAPQELGLETDNPLLVKELGNILTKCLEKLPALWFSVFSMKHMDDLESDKICLDLKLTDSNFWVIMHRTKLNLRACLQKHWS